jgi:hypothetical protein
MESVELINVKEEPERMILTYAQDVTPMLNDAYEERKLSRRWRHSKRGIIGDHIARVPTLIFNDWIKMGMDPKNKKQVMAMIELSGYKTTKKIL